MRIKSRKQREKEYLAEYGDISIDLYERIKNRLNGRLTKSLVDSLKNRLQDVNDNIKYNELRFIFYEKPIQAHRPRINYSSHIMYSPNAKENSKAIESFVESLKNSFSVIAVPMKIKLNAYYPMPKNINDLEFLIYELGLDYAIGKPDFDNVLKAYCDMLLRTVILDDDLIASAEFNKYFSIKPRVELSILYTNGYTSEYAYKTITKRKLFLELFNNTDCKLLVKKYKRNRGEK